MTSTVLASKATQQEKVCVVVRQWCRPLIREEKCGKCDVIIPVVHSCKLKVDLAKLHAYCVVGPTGEEVAGGWGRLHNEELHNL
jgi:hypothetical protein